MDAAIMAATAVTAAIVTMTVTTAAMARMGARTEAHIMATITVIAAATMAVMAATDAGTTEEARPEIKADMATRAAKIPDRATGAMRVAKATGNN